MTPSPDDIKTVLQLCEILLPVNRQKCAVLDLGGRNARFAYQIEDEPITEVEKYVHLCVTIQNDLKWSEYISIIVKIVNLFIFVLPNLPKGFKNYRLTASRKEVKDFLWSFNSY